MNTLQLQFLILILVGWVNRSQQDVIEYLPAENRVLREQLGKQRLLFTDRQRRRLAVRAKAIGRKRLFEICTLVTTRQLASLVPQADRQEVRWRTGSQARPPAHSGRNRGARHPDGAGQPSLGLHANPGRPPHDRDPLFAKTFREVLGSSGVRTVRLPARSPNLNAYAERFVRSIKSECLAQIIPVGERHLRTAVNEYTEHYHLERNHQGLENELIEDRRGAVDMSADIERHQRLGEIMNYYDRRAA
jgi:transposase InsO family protein